MDSSSFPCKDSMASPENTSLEQHHPRGMTLHPHIGSQGEIFAFSLWQSLSWAPLLKQHLLKDLQVTNKESDSLPSVLEEAFDNWDYQVYVCYLCFLSALILKLCLIR